MRRFLIFIPAVGVAVGLGVFLGSSGSAGPHGPQNAPAQRLDHHESVQGGLELDPPASTYQPQITADEILAKANAEFNPSDGATASLTLADYTDQQTDMSGKRQHLSEHVWVVAYDNLCSSSTKACQYTQWNLVYDADTGERIVAWSPYGGD